MPINGFAGEGTRNRTNNFSKIRQNRLMITVGRGNKGPLSLFKREPTVITDKIGEMFGKYPRRISSPEKGGA